MYGEDDIVDYVVEAVFENGRYLVRANVSRTAPIVDVTVFATSLPVSGVGTDYGSKSGLCEFELVPSNGLLSGACGRFLSHVAVCPALCGDVWLGSMPTL